MKKGGLITAILLLTCLAWAQKKYPLEEEDPAVIQLLIDANIDLSHPKIITYSDPWEELLRVHAELQFYERLLALGKAVEPEVITDINGSPLVQAIESGNAEVVDFLIKEGADVNRLHRDGMTPVHYAVMEEDPTILARLIQAGGNINKTDERGNTPLHTLFRTYSSTDNVGKKVERIQLLLSRGINVNAVNLGGNTPLIMAVSVAACRPEIVQALLAGETDVNIINSQEKTALIAAAENVAYPDIITLLLNAGADASLEDNTGRTALDWFDLNQRINRSLVRKALKDAM
jgi:ankyrin repeat protein